MRRFLLLLVNEIKLARTGIIIHIIAILQPTVLYSLMAFILVHPTFDMNVIRPTSAIGHALVEAMDKVGSPIGEPYINVILVDDQESRDYRQVVSVEVREGDITAVQRYGLVDSNIVKNYRNRLTSAALILWNTSLGSQAVTIKEQPWLPHDVPYKIYFGLAALPLAVTVAASFVGSMLTAQDFEFDTILEYRLSPISPGLILGARLTRLVFTGFLSVGVLTIAIGLTTGVWPSSLVRAGLILLPIAVVAGAFGITIGLGLRRAIPSFIIALMTSFVGWILGSAFGLAAGFSGSYEFLSRLTPNTHSVELLFPLYYGIRVGTPHASALVLVFMSIGMVVITVLIYRWRVLKAL